MHQIQNQTITKQPFKKTKTSWEQQEKKNIKVRRTLGFFRDISRWCTVHPSFMQLFFITLTRVPQPQTTWLYVSASNTNYVLLPLIPKRVSEKSDLLVQKPHSSSYNYSHPHSEEHNYMHIQYITYQISYFFHQDMLFLNVTCNIFQCLLISFIAYYLIN